MSEPKLNIKEESSTKKTRSPPKKAKVEQTVPKKKKLKTDADKAAEKAQHLRFGKAELTPDERRRTVSAVRRAVGARGEFAFYGFALVGTISDRGDFRFRGLVGSLFFIPYKKNRLRVCGVAGSGLFVNYVFPTGRAFRRGAVRPFASARSFGEVEPGARFLGERASAG